MNRPDKKKRKFTYFENEDVFAGLKEMAKEETERRGHVVTIPELIREITLKRANGYLTKHGKKPIEYDPSAGKFAPGGVGSAAQAIVDLQKGVVQAFDSKGNKLPEFKRVEDMPHLSRLYPKCKITFAPMRKTA